MRKNVPIVRRASGRAIWMSKKWEIWSACNAASAGRNARRMRSLSDAGWQRGRTERERITLPHESSGVARIFIEYFDGEENDT